MSGSNALNAHVKQAPQRLAVVWFTGSTALVEGQGLCYDWDRGSAGEADGRRFTYVELPSTTNAQHFAGVAARDYAACSGGQMIEIYLPGSICNVHAKANCTIGVGLLTFDVTSSYQGFFRYSGLAGEGSCIPLQTVDRSTTAGKVFAKLCEGQPSGGVEVVPIVNNGSIGTLMIGGTTLVVGATIATGNCTYTLADGVAQGLRKKFGVITTEIATNNLVITVTNGCSHQLDDAALATVTFVGASTNVGMEITLEWGGAWVVVSKTKTDPVIA